MGIIGLVTEVGLNFVRRGPSSRRREVALLCVLCGGIAALLSLFIVPELLIRHRVGQALWLLTAPLGAGLLAAWTARLGGERSGAFRFTCAALFMLSLSLGRLVFCN